MQTLCVIYGHCHAKEPNEVFWDPMDARIQQRKGTWWNFPGDPVVNSLTSSALSVSSVPGQGTEIPLASQPKNQNIKAIL